MVFFVIIIISISLRLYYNLYWFSVNDSSHEILNKIYSTVVSINTHVQRLDARMEKLEKKYCSFNSSVPLQMTINSFNDDFLNLFPLKSIENIINIENMIRDNKEFETKIVCDPFI